MNINAYKEYRFSHGILTAPKTGNTYQFRISQNDRFYNYMKEHIANETVNGLTNIKIDELCVTDSANTFFSEQRFNLDTIMLVTDKNNMVTAYSVTIKNVKVISNSVSKREYNKDYWKLSLYELEIPWQTEISIAKINDN